MRRVISLPLDEVVPSDAVVIERLGMPSWAAPSDAVLTLIHEARALLIGNASPEAVVQEIPRDDFVRVFRGDGRNDAETPLDEIVPRATALALFVGTIGPAVGRCIDAFFVAGDPAMAMTLDAFASETANGIAEALAKRFAADSGDGSRVLPYSPGYCGWHVSGQRALFASIQPSDIGVSINASFLMNPLKSVSGVLIAGDAGTHRFRPRWTFCEECAGRDCGPRMGSVR